MAERH